MSYDIKPWATGCIASAVAVEQHFYMNAAVVVVRPVGQPYFSCLARFNQLINMKTAGLNFHSFTP